MHISLIIYSVHIIYAVLPKQKKMVCVFHISWWYECQIIIVLWTLLISGFIKFKACLFFSIICICTFIASIALKILQKLFKRFKHCRIYSSMVCFIFYYLTLMELSKSLLYTSKNAKIQLITFKKLNGIITIYKTYCNMLVRLWIKFKYYVNIYRNFHYWK